METTLTIPGLLLTLLLKVGVASSIAALLARWNAFRRVLFTEERDPDQKLKLMLFTVPPLLLGVILRVWGPYKFADLSLEGAFLMGLLGGRVVGPIGGAIVTIPALIAHEWLAMPAAATAGLLGGLIRQLIPDKEDLWNFGPFTFLNIPKAIMRMVTRAEIMWEMLPLMTCVGLESGRVALVMATAKPKWLFAIDPYWNWGLILVVIGTLMSVAAPLKIWNNTRIEMDLERHQQLLLRARMDALSSQINPHFLFNTLNTVTALIRVDPDTARGVVLKLSNILRRLLRKHETFVPLREELSFIDDYLDIEVARFGHDNLDIVKEIDENTLETFIPSMLLQPIVENSLKHGLAPKLEGGRIFLRTASRDGRLHIEIEDNGVGISEEKLPHVYVEGIGLSNVRERLRVLYGADFNLDIASHEGQGTTIKINVPQLVPAIPEVSVI